MDLLTSHNGLQGDLSRPKGRGFRPGVLTNAEDAAKLTRRDRPFKYSVEISSGTEWPHSVLGPLLILFAPRFARGMPTVFVQISAGLPSKALT